MGERRLNPPPSPQRVNRWIWISLGMIILIFLITRFFPFSADQDGFGLGPKVGIVKLEGVIICSEKVVRELTEFSERDDVKAIVLRIESPGGVVAPSQEIYEKVKSLKGEKPIITSIGNVAASGGYYAAIESEIIVANKGSITGSIGVVLDYPVATELLNKIGLRFETVKSGPLKDVGSPTREVSDADRRNLQAVIDDLHSQFVAAVAQGRNLDIEAVSAFADGRVFSGIQSLKLGLIDTLGTFEDAVKIAAELGNISGKPKTIRIRTKKPSFWNLLFGDLEQTLSSWFLVEPAYLWRWE